ncbi:dynamin family protein [Sporosarcina contaminans]|uniref:Dynamin family protein n=1 Tax=Sporosarcina contaminans TaxID=633403 RepID=A0ABW3TTV8_9BACL
MMSQHNYLEKTATYGQIFKESHDHERLQKAELLAKKIINKEYVIAFAGHFSAGKSSMINALTGEDLLPSSPIPTSANIVKIKKTNEDFAIIHRTDGSVLKYEGHGFPEAIKSFSKDGAEIYQIEIGHTASHLPEGITVMDTPGVDSTDDAHRLSTESALHLADLVFYTMDYNHVQSELNFTFTKELMKYNENMYLIINMIDKHRDSELSFEDFKKSVKDAFELWGVYPKGIFYTSLRDKNHPYNDFEKVKEIVEGSIENYEERFYYNADQSLAKLKDEHTIYLQTEIDDRKSLYEQLVVEHEWSEVNELKKELAAQKNQLTLLSGDEFYATFESNRSELLRNASITPFETRELLKDHLEAKSPKFKVGLLFGAKKTAEEKARRKQALSDNLSKLLHSQIETHLKSLMKTSLKNAGLLTDERSIEIDSMDMRIPFEEIDQHLIGADVMTGDTILNMAEQMKTAVASLYKKLTDPWKKEMSSIASASGNEKTEPLMQSIRILEEKVAAIEQVNELKTQLDHIDAWIASPPTELLRKRNELLSEWKKETKIEKIELTPQLEEASSLEISEKVAENKREDNDEVAQFDTNSTIESALHVANAVSSIKGFMESAQYLKNKAKRLENQEFTVALFGAFSAGKSSFSNALIGDRVLPVSPNPTTAAINRIRPVAEGKEDRTADVHLKNEQQMTEDVALSFEALGEQISSLDEAYRLAEEVVQKELVDESLHIHKSFIRAFHKGYSTYSESLGQTMNVNQDEFSRFVAEEERSCFVDSIDLFIDCPLTRQGITLVDTPGADSINARHTDVAFEYIRNADAILFVTYYNHAFARADREFLIQLGRVKDAFELDKMFFIVNAIDLATDNEEANAVKSFVEQQMLTFGIRNPRVHGISSLQALQSKLDGTANRDMERFESDFAHFLKNDLKGLSVQALTEETVKTVERVRTLIERTEQNMTRKAERLTELDQIEQAIRIHYGQSFTEVIRKAADNELNELLYYVLQRVFLRFGDFFKEGYSPSTFATYQTDKALSIALAETVQMVGFDLTQELKVTNLRMLNFMTKLLKERQHIEMRFLNEKDSSLSPSPYEPEDAQMLSFSAPFTDVNVYKDVNRLFKNQKAFFEKGERLVLKEKLEERLKVDASHYLGKEKEHIEQWANQWIDSEAEGLRQHLLLQSIQQIESERTLLQRTEQLEEWRKIYDSIRTKEMV